MPVRLLAEQSLQQRYALQTACAVCLATLLGMVGLLLVDDWVDADLCDQQLGAVATALASPLVPANAPPDVLYQVWQRDGTLLQRSHPTPGNVPLVDLAKQGFFDMELHGHRYRTYALPSPDGQSVVQVARRVSGREPISLLMVLAGLVSMLVPLFLTWRASGVLLRRSLRLLDTLAVGVHQRDLQDSRPVQLDEPPREIMGILNSVNQLVRRSARVITQEQGFTSVAAHELRAPLAGIRAQAQLASRADSMAELKQALQGVMTGVDTVSHAFDQLLDLTRMEGLGSPGAAAFEPVDLLTLVRQVAQELQPKMQQRQIRLTQHLAPQQLNGVPFAIYLVLRNLIANAVLYTPPGGQVEVSSLRVDDHLLLRVDDSGNGIAEADRVRVFARYTRLQPHHAEGIGLGLSIVQQAVQLHAAHIRLERAPCGGLRVEISFPA